MLAPLEAAQPPRRPRLFILSYSDITRDARVARQAQYLSSRFDVVLAGWGARPAVADLPGVTWHGLPSGRSRVARLLGFALLAVGRVVPAAYSLWHRLRPGHAQALATALEQRCDLYYANDWFALPVAAAGARAHGARLVFDAHEYSPLELESSRLWRLLYRPLVLKVLARYAPQCSASVTVSRPIAERYAREYPLHPVVVLNAPALGVVAPARPVRETIRMIHHGNAMRERRIERMIDAVARTERPMHLDLMLVGDSSYIADLKEYAARQAPGRVDFPEPVPPNRIVEVLSEYDLGLYILDAHMFNHAMAMPNKFFDFLAAGLAVCIGPSPAMREVVEQYGFGVVCPTTEPADCAAALDSLTPADVRRMKGAAMAARESLNADVEMAKLVSLVTEVLERADDATPPRTPR
jgi:glycosyltransferase involved in cell wall biosynthesis